MTGGAPRPPALREAAGLGRALSFQSETDEIVQQPEPIEMRVTLYAFGGLLAALVAISTVFQIDRVVTTTYGEVQTTRPTLALQALDASIVKAIDASEGQRVRAGDELMTLDPTFATADADTLRLQLASLDAQIARAEAELAHKPAPAADAGANPYVALQRAYYVQRKAQYDEQVRGYDEQIAQNQATIAKLGRDMELYGRRGALAQSVVEMRVELERKEVGSRLDRLAALDTQLEIQRNLEFDRNGIVESQHQLSSTVANRDAFLQQWLTEVSQELVTALNSRDNAEQQLAKAARHQDLVRIVAPEDAVVLSIPKISVGSVLKEGDPLLNLALLDSPMEVEGHIATKDVGFVRAGDEVTLKFDAFNFVEHGSASGEVLWISEGTFNIDPVTGTSTTTDGQTVPPYYKARIGLADVKLHDVPASFRIIPGMTVTADIHVGTRSLFMYLVRGVVRDTGEAMREP